MYIRRKISGRKSRHEIDDRYRHRLVQGEVHDENAYAIGGVSGHAGDLQHFTGPACILSQMLLNGGVYVHNRILKRSTIAEFIVPRPSRRTLVRSRPGRCPRRQFQRPLFSAHSYGHTGFTGTTISVDPDRQIFVVLLTNRVNPTRENMKITQVRPAVHDAIMKALGYGTEK